MKYACRNSFKNSDLIPQFHGAFTGILIVTQLAKGYGCLGFFAGCGQGFRIDILLFKGVEDGGGLNHDRGGLNYVGMLNRCFNGSVGVVGSAERHSNHCAYDSYHSKNSQRYLYAPFCILPPCRGCALVCGLYLGGLFAAA